MKRRLLLVENDTDAQNWLLDLLKQRFRSLNVMGVSNLDDASRAIVDYGCDLIITNAVLPDAESPVGVVNTLQSYAQGTPLIAMFPAEHGDTELIDVIALGIRHVLYKEDIVRDHGSLISAIVDILKELASREKNNDGITGQVQALSNKVYEVDGRIRAMETVLGTLTLSIEKMTQVVEKRGGLEDRLKEREKSHKLGVKIVTWVIGLLATSVGAIISAVATYFLGK